MAPSARALIAEDEPLLADALRGELQRAWPQLDVVALAADGVEAVEQALALLPDVLFLDVRMPGLDGLAAARAIAAQWPAGRTAPLVVFVTAYEQYALDAFDAAAIDYVQKPVRADRLARTAERLQAALAARRAPPLDATLAQLQQLLALAAPHLRWLAASAPGSQGGDVRMVPVAEVLLLEAADKHVRIRTAQGEHWVRTPLKELLAQLDGRTFWQVHRGTAVRADAVERAVRDDTGRVALTVRGLDEPVDVSRAYAGLFKAL